MNPAIDAAERLQEILAQFHRDGFAVVPGVIPSDEVLALRSEIDAIFADPEAMKRHQHGFPFVAARLYTEFAHFAELMERPSLLSIAEAILGPGCTPVGENAIRTVPSVAISHWHVDDVLEFPLPPEVPRHDPRAQMPVNWLTLQVALSDIDSDAHGPTQCVPGSHYSGHQPNDPHAPVFEGRGPVSILCKAGDVYIQNHQCWHRGAPNTSDRTRYILQLQYGALWAVRRFTGIA